MAYIKENHNQTATYIPSNIQWVGGLVETSMDGSGTYSWVGDGWNVTEQYPVVPNPIYTVNATYTSTQVQIIWHGTWQYGNITEINFILNSLVVSEQEQVRDDCMNYIKTQHNETAPYISADINWIGGRVNTSLLGSETYSWVGSDWNITEQCPVVHSPVYTVTATYNSAQVQILWTGTWENGNITETDFVFTSSEVSEQEQVRDDCMAYIKENHSQTAPYIPASISWTGGQENTTLFGSQSYSWTSDGWTLTEQYPIVINPIYTVTAIYNSSQVHIVWEGTWQGGVIVESNFVFNSSEVSEQEQVRDDCMNYIKMNHNEAAPYIPATLIWVGGRVNTSLVGSETYTWVSGNWSLTEQYPVIPNTTYTVAAIYNSSAATIMWNGTWQDGNITESSFVFNATEVSMQEQARDDVMAYIKLMHNETAQYIPENMVWTGGRVNVSLIGSDTYSYVSDKWNLTLQYPVVLNPIFNVNATYNSSVIVWRGTWQNGNITETYFNMTGNMTENLQLQVCNEVIAFINASHPEVAPYIPSDMNWSGGRQNTSLLGSETYIFTSALWNVTLQYPVVPDPIFNVNATYNTSTIVWRGTWQSGSITETYFSANQTGPSPLPVNITLFAGDNAFGTTPTSLTSPGPPIVIPVNTVVTVTVTNVGTMPHAWAFTVQPTSQSTILFVIGSANNPLMPSETASTTFTMIQTGTFYYISLLQGDVAQGLWGTATVTL
jgi:uncharacterized protein YbdZ (MbtH family)